MEHHQLAQLQEKLLHLEKQLRNPKIFANQRVSIEGQIRSIKGRIDGLGKRGTLKMVIVLRQKYDEKPEPQTFFFMDLDDGSIYSLLDHNLKNGERYLSKSIIQIPMAKPIASKLENNILCWQIIS